MLFKNRSEAGKLLAQQLEAYRGTNSIVLALPRGGVPVGYEIARSLDLPLDIILIKKIGHPANKEYAIGAVSQEEGFINPFVSVSQAYIQQEVERIREKLKVHYKLYMGGRTPTRLTGKNVIVVDDGIATGHTVRAAITLVKKAGPGKIILAVPVAPNSIVPALSSQVGELVCLQPVEDFHAVGEFYVDYSNITDSEVQRLLQQARPAAR